MATNYGVKYITARERVLQLLGDLDWHSWKGLKKVGGVRYSARILELKRLGYKIDDRDREEHGKDYRLLSPYPSTPQTKRVKIFMDEWDAQALIGGRVTPAARNAVDEGLQSFLVNKNKL